MAIFIIQVTTNKEERAVDMIAERAEKKSIEVFSVAIPAGLKGYIILEAEDRESAEEAVFNLPYVKGILGNTITYEEIENMMEPSASAISIKEGDIVEMIGATLKGEKAKVLRIDKQKEEVVVSLLGAAVQLPVTVKLDNVKVIRREEGEEDEAQETNEKEKSKKDSQEKMKEQTKQQSNMMLDEPEIVPGLSGLGLGDLNEY